MWVRSVVIGVAAIIAVPSLVQADKQYVQVRKASVRDNHAALAKVVATLAFAEPVQTTGKFGTAWIKITARAASIAGWVRKSTLTETEPQLDTEGSTGSASRTEASLAGRGWTQAKDQYVADNNLGAAMRKVEAIERDPTTSASIDEIIAFLRAGNVQTKEGN